MERVDSGESVAHRRPRFYDCRGFAEDRLEERPRVGLVVENEDSGSFEGAASLRSLLQRARFGGGIDERRWSDGAHRQDDTKACSLAGAVARNRNSTAMQLHDVPHDREPKPEPAELASRRAVGLLETLENVRQKIGLDTVSGVRYRNRHAGPVLLYPQGDSPAGLAELDGVGEKVPGHLLEALSVPH